MQWSTKYRENLSCWGFLLKGRQKTGLASIVQGISLLHVLNSGAELQNASCLKT